MLKHAKIGALEIAYDEVGTGERPFVILHGFTGARDDFADVLEPIGTLGRTLVPDLRGHGDTTNPGEGYSLGGMIALRLVLGETERVALLVLMNTAARSNSANSDRALVVIKWITRRIPIGWHWPALKASRRRLPEAARRAAQKMGSERDWARIRAKLEALDPVAFDQLLRAIVRQQPIRNRLQEIRCPTLVMVGDQDVSFLEPSREMADAIPDAKLVIIKNAHHSPQIEACDAWFAAIRAHLERVRA